MIKTVAYYLTSRASSICQFHFHLSQFHFPLWQFDWLCGYRRPQINKSCRLSLISSKTWSWTWSHETSCNHDELLLALTHRFSRCARRVGLTPATLVFFKRILMEWKMQGGPTGCRFFFFPWFLARSLHGMAVLGESGQSQAVKLSMLWRDPKYCTLLTIPACDPQSLISSGYYDGDACCCLFHMHNLKPSAPTTYCFCSCAQSESEKVLQSLTANGCPNIKADDK